MVNKCVKLILIIALVVTVAFGVSFLPFSLSDKFREVAEKLTEKIRGLSQRGNSGIDKIHLDFAKTDAYKIGNFNIVMEKTDNVPKEGFHKLIHRGENDKPLDVEKFLIGDIEINGLETGLIDYAAGYFKADLPHLVIIELKLHQKDEAGIPVGNAANIKAIPSGNGHVPDPAAINTNNGAAGSAGANGINDIAGQTPANTTTSHIIFYAPGENNNWIKLPEGINIAEKAEQVLATLIARAAQASPAISEIDAALCDPNLADLAAKVAMNSRPNGNLRGRTSTPIIEGESEPVQATAEDAGIPATRVSIPTVIPTAKPEIPKPAPAGTGIGKTNSRVSTPIAECIANHGAGPTGSEGIRNIIGGSGSSISGGIGEAANSATGIGGIAGGAQQIS